MKKIEKLIRPNILKLQPYSCARDEFQGTASVYMDANENPFNEPYNRYPDPLQREIKQRLALLKGVNTEHIFLGVGSDEPIDLLIRAFCEPGIDNIVAPDPTYGMYQVAAGINDVLYKKVLLQEDYTLCVERLLDSVDEYTKLIFLCSPNNPTGNLLDRQEVIKVIASFEGLVIVDEAYIDFSPSDSYLSLLDQYPNLVILQTFSKAWGCAGVRLGMAFASKEIIAVLNKIKYPYNINELTQRYILSLLDKKEEVDQYIATLLQEKERMVEAFTSVPLVDKVYPSDANFLLVKVPDADALYKILIQEGIVVRNRNCVSLCRGCLRITIGTPQENDLLIQLLKRL